MQARITDAVLENEEITVQTKTCLFYMLFLMVIFVKFSSQNLNTARFIVW